MNFQHCNELRFNFLILSLCVCVFQTNAQKIISLDANDKGRLFEGIGAVSAGASSRNLVDYPEKQRGEVLDFLFKPKFGAGFQHLKVEIGGGENSTCGSEPSHAISLDEMKNPKPRGYEFWLMSEARKRNPSIILDCLPWSYPNWVGNPFTKEAADWFVAFLKVAKKYYGLNVDWISAAQNESGTDLNWIAKYLRPALKANGFSNVKLQGPDDDSEFWEIFDELEKKPVYDSLIDAVGYHYLDGREPWDIDQKNNHAATAKSKNSGKALWASEEWSQSGKTWDGVGALYLARLMNKLYTRDRTSKYLIWCPVDGIYNQIIWANTGVMQADAPWSGRYDVWPAVWAVAHTTQFAEPGWRYMDNACGRFDTSTWRGSYVALRNPKTDDWSVIIVTGQKQKVKLNIGKGLKSDSVYVWRSDEKEQFINEKRLLVDNSFIELELVPDAIYTVTTTTGQKKGWYPKVADEPFPFPYTEKFDNYKPGKTPKYFSDQKGTFETCKSPMGGMSLAQIVPEQGVLWHDNLLLKPHTLFGDINWEDYTISADVLLRGGDVEIGGRYHNRNKLGYRWILAEDGQWKLNWLDSTLASGKILQFHKKAWHHLRLQMNGTKIKGFIDGKELASVSSQQPPSKGMAFIACTYNQNLFDNIRVNKNVR